MRHLSEYRDAELARALASRIATEIRDDRSYRFMEFCGGHTHALFRHGVPDLLPAQVEMIHGPGCPVCVLPVGRLDMAIALARRPGVILASYGDMLRVPGSGRASLQRAKAEGADVRVVYAVTDALALARAHPDREVVFFAIGFETTTPPTALALQQARVEGLTNFRVFCNHVLTPPAVAAVSAFDVEADGAGRLDGFVGPGHVCVVVGTRDFEQFSRDGRKPVVIAGFEPLDLLQAILMLVRQVNTGAARVEIQYRRAVRPEGNPIAQDAMREVFEVRPSFAWRGLGNVPNSALAIRDVYAAFDAERCFALEDHIVPENAACLCPRILRGAARPADCPLFANGCAPDTPVGSCMVSTEGACAAHYAYARHRMDGAGASAA